MFLITVVDSDEKKTKVEIQKQCIKDLDNCQCCSGKQLKKLLTDTNIDTLQIDLDLVKLLYCNGSKYLGNLYAKIHVIELIDTLCLPSVYQVKFYNPVDEDNPLMTTDEIDKAVVKTYGNNSDTS
jgi:hypothetical protein